MKNKPCFRRFAQNGVKSLLPQALAREALRPQLIAGED